MARERPRPACACTAAAVARMAPAQSPHHTTSHHTWQQPPHHITSHHTTPHMAAATTSHHITPHHTWQQSCSCQQGASPAAHLPPQLQDGSVVGPGRVQLIQEGAHKVLPPVAPHAHLPAAAALVPAHAAVPAVQHKPTSVGGCTEAQRRGWLHGGSAVWPQSAACCTVRTCNPHRHSCQLQCTGYASQLEVPDRKHPPPPTHLLEPFPPEPLLLGLPPDAGRWSTSGSHVDRYAARPAHTAPHCCFTG